MDADQPQTVDDFIVSLKSKKETAVELSLEELQQKIVNGMGPLAGVGKAIEDVYICNNLAHRGSSCEYGQDCAAFGASISRSGLPMSVHRSLLGHEKSSKTETDLKRETKFAFRRAPDVIWG